MARFFLACFGFAFSFTLAAQPPAQLEFSRPAERRLPEPEFSTPKEVLPRVLPPAPSLRPQSRAASVVVRLKAIELDGNTVFSDAELGQIIAPYLNRALSTEDLNDLRDGLTRHYVDRGYINSGALIPDQKVSDGVIRVQIVEGRISELQVEGNKWLRNKYLSDRIALGTTPPLNINTLQEQLQIQAQSALIERLNADIQPGDRPGDARLKVRVEEPERFQLVTFLDNRLSPDLGKGQARVVARLNNPTGWGDVLTGGFNYAEGFRSFLADYTLPLNRWDTTLGLFGEIGKSRIVEAPLDELDIRGDSSALGFRINHPVYRTAREQINLGVSLEYRQSQTFLLDRPFPFAAGVKSNGKSAVTVIRLSQDWTRRSSSQVLAARSIFSIGIDAFGSTSHAGAVPDSTFFAWLGQFQWARRLTESGVQAIFRIDGQLVDGPLMPLEQFTVGGAQSVRGYRTNLLVRDWGYAASLEMRMPLLRDEVGQPILQGAVFYDMGGAWQRDRSTLNPRTISSVGLGLRWDPNEKVHGEVYLGLPLREVDLPNHDIQDVGIHFQFSAALF